MNSKLNSAAKAVILEARAALKRSKEFIHSQYLSSGMTETHTQEEWEEYLHNKDFSHVEEFNRRILNGERITFSPLGLAARESDER